jgi:hypothetical protein
MLEHGRAIQLVLDALQALSGLHVPQKHLLCSGHLDCVSAAYVTKSNMSPCSGQEASHI